MAVSTALNHDELPADVVEAIHAQQTILAIKRLREHRGIDLKTAKETVDAYINLHPHLAAKRKAVSEGSLRTLKLIGLLILAAYAAYRLLG